MPKCQLLTTSPKLTQFKLQMELLIPEHCHRVQIREQQATSNFLEQQNILFLTDEQGKASYTPVSENYLEKQKEKVIII